MSKKNDTPAIEVGKTISMEDTSRKGLTQQICELVSKAEKQGLRAQGGFIEYDGGERFATTITFVKP